MTDATIIVLADGFEELEAIAPIDLLRRAGVPLKIVGLHATTVISSRKVTVCADGVLSDHLADDTNIILPGGPGVVNLMKSDALISLVSSIFAKGNLCAAICAAPSVFGKAGILAGKRATCFPGHEVNLVGASIIDAPVVCDGNIITSRSAGTSIPFALAIIEYLKCKEDAHTIARAILL